jgi:hypothetical protein
MRCNNAQLRIVIALVALTVCGAASAAPTGKLWVNWNGEVVQVATDPSYTCEHPEQAGLQAVVADNRERIGLAEDRLDGHDTDIANLSGRVNTLENEPNPPAATVIVPAPPATIIPAPAPAPAPRAIVPGPPSPARTSGAMPPPPPPDPGKEGRPPMDVWEIYTPIWITLFILGVLTIGLAAFFRWNEIAAKRREDEDKLRQAQAQAALNAQVSRQNAATLLRARTIAERSQLQSASMEGQVTDAYGQIIATVETGRTEQGFFQQAALALAPAGGAPVVTARERTAAIASLARPSTAVAAGAPALAAPAAINPTAANVDALAAALVGINIADPRLVDLTRDNLVVAGQVTR